jgi:hypothetical protein
VNDYSALIARAQANGAKLLNATAAAPKVARPTKYGPRHVAGQMNKTEAEFAEILKVQQLSGAVRWWAFESITLRLAKDCRYTPDFMVLLADGSTEMIDVKGGGPIDAKSKVKLRVAADQFRHWRFAIEQKLKGAGWKRTDFRPT